MPPEILEKAREFINNFHRDQREQAGSVYMSLFTRTSLSYQTKTNIIIDDVCEYYRNTLNRSKVPKTKIEICLEVIIGNVIESENGYVSYRRLKNDFTLGIYNPYRVSYAVLVDTIDALNELKYIKHYKGIKSQAASKQISKFKPLTHLTKLINGLETTRVSEVEIRDANKKPVELKNNKYVSIQRSLEFINKTLRQSKYFCNNEAVRVPVLKRVYNLSSFSYGGRFYSTGLFNYQGLGKEERSNILINDKPTVEVDYKSIHPNILYSMIGEQLDKDPYFIDGIDRGIVKALFLILVNSKNELMVKRAVKEKLGYTHKITQDIIDKILENNREIKDLFFNDNIGLRLQNLDSKIAEEVMLKFIKKCGRPILPIHDSFIVVESDKDLLTDIMIEVYRDTTGFYIELS